MPEIGYRPPSGYNINLGRTDDFNGGFYRPDGEDFPAGATVTMLIYNGGLQVASWPATVQPAASTDSGNAEATWSVDKTAVASLAAATAEAARMPLRIVYADASGLEQTWFTGVVKWFD